MFVGVFEHLGLFFSGVVVRSAAARCGGAKKRGSPHVGATCVAMACVSTPILHMAGIEARRAPTPRRSLPRGVAAGENGLETDI